MIYINEITEALRYIDPAMLTYQEWVSVGMAIKHEGLPVSVWDDWSKADRRYHAGECTKKWESFQGSSEPVTGATVFQMAQENGWHPAHGHELSWNDEIFCDEEAPSAAQEDCQQLITYLKTLFQRKISAL